MHERMISVVGCHAEGEVDDVIVGGVLPPAGATMFEKKLTMERDHDEIRQLLIREPRGSIGRHVNLVVQKWSPNSGNRPPSRWPSRIGTTAAGCQTCSGESIPMPSRRRPRSRARPR